MKRVFALILAGMVSLSLAACSSEPDQTSSQLPESSMEQTESTLPPESDSESDPEPENTGSLTVGQTLLKDFQDRIAANADLSAQELADALITNEIILFQGATMPVEPGLLMGFGETEITGFKEGVMFAPMIGTIPFIGYVFVLEDGTDAAAFMQTLNDNADPRWNICTEAEETVLELSGNTVFFLMCPKTLEE